jgi:HSP90 family molecular chaperone
MSRHADADKLIHSRKRRRNVAKAAHFKVDPRLASLLGEGYRSSEEALRELVDNAWDADAENVSIHLPIEVSGGAIVVQDDGTGMTENELRGEYLYVANDRRTRKGEATTEKKRHVKGRKGIGKFAGLMAADTMVPPTGARSSRIASGSARSSNGQPRVSEPRSSRRSRTR